MSMEYYALHSPNEGSYKQKDVRLYESQLSIYLESNSAV